MKHIILSFSFIFFTLFSFAGGCTVSANHSIFENEEGVFARLTASLDQHCYPCTADGGRWYKLKGSVYVPINKSANNQWDVSEPGIYKVELCGTYGITQVKDGSVYKNALTNEQIDVTTKFIIAPNPAIDGVLNIFPPNKDSSLKKYSFDVFSLEGESIYSEDVTIESVFQRSTFVLPTHRRGLFLIRIIYGEEVEVLKVVMM